MKFLIGPHCQGQWWTIPEAPACWILRHMQPRCETCGRQVHLVFDTAARVGVASCGCELVGERAFHRSENQQRGAAA